MNFSSSLDQFIGSAHAAGAGTTPADEVAFRAQAWQAHEKMGWPSAKTETWRYTTAASLLQSEFIWSQQSYELSADEQAEMARWAQSFEVIAFKNGRIVSTGERSMGVHITPVDRAWPRLTELNWRWSDGFTPAMAAAASGGAWIEVSQSLPRPLLIVHFQSGLRSCASDLVVLQVAAGCAAHVLECWVSQEETFSATQSVVSLGENAQLVYGRVTRGHSTCRHFSDLQMYLQRAARATLTNVHLGRAWARGHLTATLEGEGAEVVMSGIAFGSSQEHYDQRMEARHLAPRTKSYQLFKGLWRDRSRGVINGKIYIAPNAQQVDSAQLNHNLLLSKMAEADTKPELEVYADDVKANHGASVGRMDEDKLFYLQSRGISRAQAVHLLAEGFIQDVVWKCESPAIRSELWAEIERILSRYVRDMEEEIR